MTIGILVLKRYNIRLQSKNIPKSNVLCLDILFLEGGDLGVSLEESLQDENTVGNNFSCVGRIKEITYPSKEPSSFS